MTDNDRKPFDRSNASSRPQKRGKGKPTGRKPAEKSFFDSGRPDDDGAQKEKRVAREKEGGQSRSRGPKDRQGGRKPDRNNEPLREGEVSDNFIYPDNPKGIAVRRAAVDILALVREGLSLDEALTQCRTYQGLERRRPVEGESSADLEKAQDKIRADRGFARAIATIVLRRRGTIDHLISPYLDRPLPKKAVRIMDILRTSAAQSLFLEIPAHASVSLATELCKERQETQGFAKLVNAVARKLSSTPQQKITQLPLRTDTPAWMWRSWERSFGPVKTKKIAKAHQKIAPLDISIKNPAELMDICEALGASRFEFNENLSSLRIQTPPRGIAKMSGFAEGKWWVQDIAASLPVALLGDVSGKRVIDLCAAPGGKTLQLAAAGAKVTAVDRSNDRLGRVRKNLARTQLEADIVIGDALDYNPHIKADIVLLDAPCSATGTIRRHPDIPWNKTETDIAGLSNLQASLIDHALTMLVDGGILLYATCSLQIEEGEKQIDKALSRQSRLQRLPFDPAEDPVLKGPWEGAVTRNGDIRLLPYMAEDDGGMDGFFIARLQKA